MPVRDNVIAIAGCISTERDGSPGPPVDDLRNLGELHLATVETATEAYESVLLHAGALPHDATSARMVRETRTGTGQQGYDADIDADQAALRQLPAPVDTDTDGVPDQWEREHGLDPENATDSNMLSESGYSYLELYCHERAERLIDAASMAGSE